MLFFCKKEWVYQLARKILAYKIIRLSNTLTPQYLIEKGFKQDEDGYFVEPYIKDRDKIWVSFDRGTYLIRHGKEKTFITREKSIEWFETYYLIIHSDNGIFKLAGI